MDKIFRAWTFWIRASLREECETYMTEVKLKEMNAAPGNERAAALFRDLGDGTVEVAVVSVWESMDMIRKYAGDEPQQPAIDPDDRKKLFDREPIVRHYTMADEKALPLIPADWR
jgi:heme-degrading monooxygenase HmoA